MVDPVISHRSKHALAVRFHGRDSEQAQNAIRDLKAVKLERHVQEVVAMSPPLTAEQLDRIAAILRGGA